LTVTKDVQCLKANSTIDVTEDGILTDVKDVQPWKAERPIVITDDGILTDVKDEQFSKAFLPIDVITDGNSKSIDTISLLEGHHSLSILSTVLGIQTCRLLLSEFMKVTMRGTHFATNCLRCSVCPSLFLSIMLFSFLAFIVKKNSTTIISSNGNNERIASMTTYAKALLINMVFVLVVAKEEGFG
jgi:hypothetical protein